MPKPNQIVINTSPLIAIIAALGDLNILQSLYMDVLFLLKSAKKYSLVVLQDWEYMNFNRHRGCKSKILH